MKKALINRIDNELLVVNKDSYMQNNKYNNSNGEYILASINDLIDDVCCGGNPIKGLIEVKEGIYTWDKIENDLLCDLGLESETEYSYIPL